METVEYVQKMHNVINAYKLITLYK